MNLCKVLSIQSHVVSGYVGNKCYALTLQVLGTEVDSINSVHLSNHTGYDSFRGQILNATDLLELYDGLRVNGLADYSHVATGYIGSRALLEQVCRVVADLKRFNQTTVFNCDPVLGDNGIMYVPRDLLEVYRDVVLPLADVLFPNQFEAELLTDTVIKNEADIIQTIKLLHSRGIKKIVITSTNLGPPGILYGYVSAILPSGSHQQLRLEIPKFPYHFVGTGDLFAALFMGWSLKHPNDLKMVCSKVIGSIQLVLQRTVNKAEFLRSRGVGNEPFRLELSLVDSIPDLMNPPCHHGVTDFFL